MTSGQALGGLRDEHVTDAVIGAAIEVHRTLGPGLLESAYEACLCHELLLREVPFSRQADLPIEYKGLRADHAFKADLIVANAVVVELKSVDRLLPVHEAQLLTYMRLSRLGTGLLLNFNTRALKEGIVRRVL